MGFQNICRSLDETVKEKKVQIGWEKERFERMCASVNVHLFKGMNEYDSFNLCIIYNFCSLTELPDNLVLLLPLDSNLPREEY